MNKRHETHDDMGDRKELELAEGVGGAIEGTKLGVPVALMVWNEYDWGAKGVEDPVFAAR